MKLPVIMKHLGGVEWHPRLIRVSITDTSSGETRSYDDVGWWEDGKFVDFIWEEGNFACDCNRGQFFIEAGGQEVTHCDDDHDDFPCGSGRYGVVLADESGIILYDDTTP